MTAQAVPPMSEPDTFPRFPGWIASRRNASLEDAAFVSGAALAHLDLLLRREEVPAALVRERLALGAAETCLVLAGRPERAADLRDAVSLLRPGDLPGPAGEVFLAWRKAVSRPLNLRTLRAALPDVDPETIALWLDSGKGGPMTRAARVMEAVLESDPRAETEALMLADASIAQALGWKHLVPILAVAMRSADLRKRDADLALACCQAATSGATVACQTASDLARKAQRLRQVVPKLRAKGADAAVDMLLSRDAISPSALTVLRSDRSARRFCDRLVALGVVRELTGRDSFRLYGL